MGGPGKKENLKPWKPGQSGNENGRPPLLIRHINEKLKGQGYERVTPSQIAEAYELLFNLSEEEIKKYLTDSKAPMLMRVVAKAMLSTKGVEMLERMLDRAHGKAKQTIDMNATLSEKRYDVGFGVEETKEEPDAGQPTDPDSF
jgi:hypothetical protein